MNPMLTRLVELESEVAYRTPPEPGRVEFDIIHGRIPVLLSAPHGAAHIRDGRLKEEDEYTAGLVRLVGEKTGAHVVYAYRKSSTDPNYYPNTPYKQSLRQHVAKHGVKFVLDVHGCSPVRKFGVALGTMHNRSCPNHLPLIIQAFTDHGFSAANHGLQRLDIDRTFPANGNENVETITGFSFHQLKIPAAQIELNARLRIVQRLPGTTSTQTVPGDPAYIMKMIQALIDVVETLNTHLN